MKKIIACAILALALTGFVYSKYMRACGCGGHQTLPPTITALPH
jgi:hypothetical protein